MGSARARVLAPLIALISTLFCGVAGASSGAILGAAPRAESHPSAPDPNLPAQDAAPSCRLRTRLELPIGGFPMGVLTGDVDGDGSAELVAVTRTPGWLSFWPEPSPEVGAQIPPRQLRIGDFPLRPVWFPPSGWKEGQPLRQVAVASRSTRELSIYELPRISAGEGGDGPTLPRLMFSVQLPGIPRALACGDLESDGQFEIAVFTSEQRLWILNELGVVAEFEVSGRRPTCARVLSDGSIAVGFQAEREVLVYEIAHASPYEIRAVQRGTLDGPPRDLSELDADGDGDLELLVVGADQSLRIFGWGRPGGRAGWFTGSEHLDLVTGAVPIDIESGDLDGDGSDELVLLNYYDLAVQVLGRAELALAATGIAVELENIYVGQSPWDSALGDFDADGELDLAVANRGAQRVSLLFGAPGREFYRPRSLRAGRGTHAVATGDLDRDGAPEAVVLNSLEDTLAVLENRRGELELGSLLAAGPAADEIELADVDTDGWIDACYLTRDATGVRLVTLFGSAGGALARRPEVPDLRVADDRGDLIFTDLDANGMPEVLITDPSSSQVILIETWRSERCAFAYGELQVIDVPGGPSALCALELDRDPGAELLVALPGPQPRQGLAILSQRLTPDRALTLSESGFQRMDVVPFDLTSADFDGDGRKDFAVLALLRHQEWHGRVIPYMRNRWEKWRASPPLTTGFKPYRIRAADLDLDGREDIVVSAQNSHHLNLWFSRAGEPARFLRAPDLGTGIGNLDFELADVDGDGRPDLVVANAFNNVVTTVLNPAP